ncbi:MAG: DNA-processing protein DprA [Candidatus Zixiibacteriota bacterium]|nr:MAG: DNA-processing protein DprA [candidate division Zixibacteria bacterium]
MSQDTRTNAAIKVLALSCFCGATPRLMEALLGYFHSIDRIFEADAGSLMTISGMTAETANRVAQANLLLEEAGEYYHALGRRDINVVSRFEENYPQRLFELNDPPSILFFRGRLPRPDVKTVALVGGEKASNEGIELTVELAGRLAAAGVQIVSSLRSGIDSAAHLGTKAGKGHSYSVLSGGLDNIYPEENRPLAIDIVGTGGLLSEHRPETAHSENGWLASNRLVAALAQAVVVTEFYSDSVHTLDLLKCCSQIGKLAFIMIDPRHGALTDEASLNRAYTYGAIPLVGLEKVPDIVDSLV